jgi:hypothetical protein
MQGLRRVKIPAAALTFAAFSACSNAGAIGDVLGGVLGGGRAQSGQVAGTIAGVNTQSQQIGLTTTDGQTVGLLFDGNTKVVYQNQLYPVTALEQGDQVVMRVQTTQDGGYYTDSVFVTRSVTGGSSSAGGSANVQALQGTVRQIDRTNGLFALETGNGVMLTVSLPYNVSRADASRFTNLRTGEHVRIYGVYLNNSRVELRQFY